MNLDKLNPYKEDTRIVATLDAGGTNFVFGAVCGGNPILSDISLKPSRDDVAECLKVFAEGFQIVFDEAKKLTGNYPCAISFAFPGPADYANGVIYGHLPNFPAFRKGVALSAFLQKKFNVPVFINNDANLFVLGESLFGLLPWLNSQLEERGSSRRLSSLVGFTLGTGLGYGAFCEGVLRIGENNCTEGFCLRGFSDPNTMVEEFVSARAIVRNYKEFSGLDNAPTPYDVFKIAEKEVDGNPEAAKKAFEKFGINLGNAIATAATLFDAPVVLGGGLAGARKYILPAVIEAASSKISSGGGESVGILQPEIYDADTPEGIEAFTKDVTGKITIFGTDEEVVFNTAPKLCVGISKLGASLAAQLGAYVYALSNLSSK